MHQLALNHLVVEKHIYMNFVSELNFLGEGGVGQLKNSFQDIQKNKPKIGHNRCTR